MKQWVYCAIMNDAINHVCRPIIMNKMHYILQNLIQSNPKTNFTNSYRS